MDLVAERLDLLFLEDPKELGLDGGMDVPDLVQKNGAPLCLLEKPLFVPGGVGEGAPAIAEKLAFQNALGDCRAVDGHEGPFPPVAQSMDGPGRQVLARSRFSGDQHRHVGFGHHLDGLVHPPHAGAPAHQALKRFMLPKTPLEPEVFPQEPASFQRLLEGPHHRLVIEGLGDEIVGSLLDGLHGQLHAPVGGHHDHRKPGMLPADDLEHFQAVDPPHFHVQESHLRRDLFQKAQSLFSRGRGFHLAFQLPFQAALEKAEHVPLVVHDQKGRPGRFHNITHVTASSWRLTGRTMVKTAPLGGRLAT